MQRVHNADALVDEAHKEQRRKTGEPYIIHPIAVARIVAEELTLGANPVIAAFLHDVAEDEGSWYEMHWIQNLLSRDYIYICNALLGQIK